MKSIFRAPELLGRTRRCATACLLLMLACSVCEASGIAGRVMNRSRNQPAAGDEVILYNVEHTMVEMARTTSGRDGSFRFETSGNFPYLVAVSLQKVSYHSKTLRGSDALELPVYDSAPKLHGIRDESNTLFVNTDGKAVGVTEFFVIANESNPPRTLAGSRTFDFTLPEGAVLESTLVQPPGTLPLRLNAASSGAKNRYCIAYPIRPGTTRLRAVYHLQQATREWITLSEPRAPTTVAVMVPVSLQLETKNRGGLVQRRTTGGLSMYLRADLHSDKPIAFRLSESGRGVAHADVRQSTGNARESLRTVNSASSLVPSQPLNIRLSKVTIALLLSVAVMAAITPGQKLYLRRPFRGGQKS